MTHTLSADRIHLLRGSATPALSIRVVDETGSTNADLLAELSTLSAPALLIARSQTAGKGRAGRDWHSVAGKSLTFSLAWKFRRPLHGLVGLPLATGVALAEALALFGVDANLKWPNDLMYKGGKLAGILTESASGSLAKNDGSWAVTGIGINMDINADDVAGSGRPVACVPRLTELDQNMLMATLLNSLVNAMEQFEQQGLAVFIPRWNRLHVYAGQRICILDHGRVIHEGIGRGVDETGRFIVETGSGQVAVAAGDVSLRPLEA